MPCPENSTYTATVVEVGTGDYIARCQLKEGSYVLLPPIAWTGLRPRKSDIVSIHGITQNVDGHWLACKAEMHTAGSAWD